MTGVKCRIQVPIPLAAKRHIFLSVIKKRISKQLHDIIIDWAERQPLVWVGDWFKRFNDCILVGTSGVPKSILEKGMPPWGLEVI